MDAFEINFSCPHGMPERKMGMAMGQDCELLEVDFATASGVRQRTGIGVAVGESCSGCVVSSDRGSAAAWMTGKPGWGCWLCAGAVMYQYQSQSLRAADRPGAEGICSLYSWT